MPLDLDLVLKLHVNWLRNEPDGMRANLEFANLESANIDFACWPLRCRSFHAKVDDNILEQLLTHVKMLDVSQCSKANKKLVESIPDRVKNKLRERHDLKI
jgi:hypothetical protein